MKSIKAQLSIAVVCIVLGLMLAYQFQNASNISSALAKKQVDELQQQLKDAQDQKQELEKSIAELDKKVEEYEKNASTVNGYTNSLKSELDKVRMLAGQSKLEGPGVEIILSPLVNDIDNKGSMVVYADYLLQLVNELNACGAEAIMINDQRIINTSTIRDVVLGVLQINGVRLSTTEQFKVMAIGDPATLEGGLKTALVQAFADYGIRMDIKQSQKVTIFKYNKVIDFKYAKPVKEGD